MESSRQLKQELTERSSMIVNDIAALSAMVSKRTEAQEDLMKTARSFSAMEDVIKATEDQVMRGVHQGIQDIKYLLEVAISNAATIPVINAQLKETIDLLHSPQDLIEGGIPE
eukprot:TRINITY_DN1654_c0_g1_i5.p1 TRINITY_DN1654_c0_g1~~TRINITY_DN1654_c0_g1_i5.p1  ORF type:complete len:113 (+),score=33.41 TRINITY_DN1654_c0_g1_i5:48-386(+)